MSDTTGPYIPVNPMSFQQTATREAWRYHFAGQALPAIIRAACTDRPFSDQEQDKLVTECVLGARLWADALLAELERTAKP